MSLSLQLHTGRAGFSLLAEGGEVVEIDFEGVSDASKITIRGDVLSFVADDSTSVTVFWDNGRVQVMIHRTQTFPSALVMRVQGLQGAQLSSTSLTGIAGTTPFFLNAQDATLQGQADALSLLLADSLARLEIVCDHNADVMSMMGEVSMLATRYTVNQSRPRPEFSISIYDDSGMTRARPMRQGVFVVSTVPAYDAAFSLSGGDMTLYEEGAGTEERTLYFRVAATRWDKSQPPVLASNYVPVLKLMLPNGIDTVAAPISVPLTQQSFTNTAYAWPVPVWTGSYTFHREDTVNFVDGLGFMYVYLDMAVTLMLDMQIEVVNIGESTEGGLEIPKIYGYQAGTFSVPEEITPLSVQEDKGTTATRKSKRSKPRGGNN